MQEREKVWIMKYLKICSLVMTVAGLLLSCGGGWIIKDHLDSRHHLREQISYDCCLEIDRYVWIIVSKSNIGQYWIALWRIYYEDEVHGLHQTRETREIWGYYSIFSQHSSWINFGCVSLGKESSLDIERWTLNVDRLCIWKSKLDNDLLKTFK